MEKKKALSMTAIILLFFLHVGNSVAKNQNTEKKPLEQDITSWLLLGPFTTPLPAFHNETKKEFNTEDFLKFNSIDVSTLKPKAQNTVKWSETTSAKWKEIKAEDKAITLTPEAELPSTAYLGSYLDIKRWTKAKISIKSPQIFQLYLNGKVILTKSKFNFSEKKQMESEGRTLSSTLELETGKNLILLKTIFDLKSHSDWTIKATLSFDEKFASSCPITTLDPEEIMSISHLLDGPKIRAISVSPDADLAALSLTQTLSPSDNVERWVELRRISDGFLLQSLRGGSPISRVNWAPSGQKFSYTIRKKNVATIWLTDLKAGTSIPILKNIKNLGSHTWSPDGAFIVYSTTEKSKSDDKSAKRFKNLADRQPWWRDRSYLYKLSINSGTTQRLTAGELTTYLNSISPNGKKLLFTRSIVDYSERPYSKTELYSLDLDKLETKLLWKGKWFGSAQWSPCGKKILILAGPSAFGKIGTNLPQGLMPNEYDTQAYLFNPETKKAVSLTKTFDPSIDQAVWSLKENCIYFITTDRSYRRLYRYDLIKKKFEYIDCGIEALRTFDLAKNKPIAAYTGSSANVPPKSYIINLNTRSYKVFQDPGKDDFTEVTFGKVERWAFKNKNGVEIEGRIYYPPGFDPNKKYPCIVNYYGGTSPITRDFGGRYPLNLYTAHGYVIYVLQPSGATGFGQEFSASHVNDWGIIVADEIIEGVKNFLKAHPFVDSKKLGCIGASYGGFMTMLIQTRTNMFTAAIAHAGISSISSYWGEGYWGYSYSACATANSFPWNRKDIYVNQSPLFNADKISTPLLLLHGSIDTNVPPGESSQLYTALKILGRPVEYIQIFDQNHHIMTYNKRILWTKTIIAWFDRWLKGQPEWWQNLYPD